MKGLAVEVKGLVKQFGGTVALGGVDLTIPAGTVHGLIGPNGSGKSTMVKILTGLYSADQGSITYDDRAGALASSLEARDRGIELVPQELSLVQGMSVWENVVLGSEPNSRGRLDVPASRRVAHEALTRLSLDLDLNVAVEQVNPAEQRLVMIARTLHRGARLLIVDEPTAGLPPSQAERVVDALRAISLEGITILFVSHHLAEVASLCDAVTVLTDGRVTGRLTGDTLNQDGLIEAIMGEASAIPPVAADADRPTPGERVIEVSGLRGNSLEHLDLQASRGEIVGLAGLLGSGREVCIDLIVGSQRRAAGSVMVSGRALNSPVLATNKRVGYVSGNRTRAVIPGWDVNKHVTLPGLR